MNDIIQNLEANATSGRENFCYISEKQLNAMKELFKRETKENKHLKERIEYLERSNNRREDTITEQYHEIVGLETRWNKLKEYIQKDYDFFGKLIDPKYGCAMGALSRVKDKMQELEQGVDSNE